MKVLIILGIIVFIFIVNLAISLVFAPMYDPVTNEFITCKNCAKDCPKKRPCSNWVPANPHIYAHHNAMNVDLGQCPKCGCKELIKNKDFECPECKTILIWK